MNAPFLKDDNGLTPTEDLEHQLNNKHNDPKPANKIIFTQPAHPDPAHLFST